MNIGTQFELDLEKELGLKRVAGSGNKWYNKLDVQGKGTRWSLKATEESGFRIDNKFIDEAAQATEGIWGTGEVPIWAVRIAQGDFIVMRKKDWIRFMMGETNFTITPSKADERRARAKTPQLMRGNNGDIES